MNRQGYIVTVTVAGKYYIPGAARVKRDIRCIPRKFDNDAAAARGAERDGTKFIYGMEGVPDGIYVDTAGNRAYITQMLYAHPECKADNINFAR